MSQTNIDSSSHVKKNKQRPPFKTELSNAPLQIIGMAIYSVQKAEKSISQHCGIIIWCSSHSCSVWFGESERGCAAEISPPLFTFKKRKLTAKQVTSQLCLCMKEGEKKLQISVGSSVQPAVFWEAEGRRCGPVRSLKGIRTCTELVPVFPEHLQRPWLCTGASLTHGKSSLLTAGKWSCSCFFQKRKWIDGG